MWFDTHAHFLEDPRAELQRACQADLAGVLAVGGSLQLNAGAISAASHCPDLVSLALGWERGQAGSIGADEAALLLHKEICKVQRQGLRLVAVGETGLDYHYDTSTAIAQRELFEMQVAMAAELGKPLVIHSRNAEEDTLAILKAAGCKKMAAAGRLGVLHCFTGDRAFAEALIEAGLYISFSGIITFRNAADLRATAAALPLERILTETDSPWLAPVPMRGKTNEPAFVKYVGACLAEARNMPEAELAAATSENARQLFIPPDATLQVPEKHT